MTTDRPRGRWADWRRVRLRRLLAALLAGAAVVVGLGALRPAPAPTRDVVVAARDVRPGERLVAADLRVESWPQDLLPADSAGRDALVGRRVLGRVVAGEPVTTSRLLTGGNLAAPAGTDLVLSVPLPDAGLARVLQVGDRVDLLDAEGATVARAAPVVAVLPGDDGGGGWKGASASTLLVAVTRAAATRIARSTAVGTGGSASLTVARALPTQGVR